MMPGTAAGTVGGLGETGIGEAGIIVLAGTIGGIEDIRGFATGGSTAVK